MDAATRRTLERSARFSRAIRENFSNSGYVEVETPVLSPFLIPEPAIEVFRTELLGSRGRGRDLYLAPSPELGMKRLIARGSGSIFQISRSFRNGDFASPLHNPEFRLLEYYTVGGTYLDSIAVTESLFSHLLDAAGPAASPEGLAPPFLRLTMEEAFRRFAGIELASCQDPPSMINAARAKGLAIEHDATWEQAFHIVFLTLVEPSLPREKPLVLMDYPALVPTTARRKPGTPWAERWELYIQGVEVANCYTEETDLAALERLFSEEAERKRGCRVPHETDREIPRLIAAGPSRCSGVALGVDRLEMLFFGEHDLGGVIIFPLSSRIRPFPEMD
ncbi:MAG: elongation factor P--(R)-beta-lysine ligase [Spirochaetes bacterium]|nr:elongation factor P--(R)-beta-lysine ligase [Spirochaetota bacterium]